MTVRCIFEQCDSTVFKFPAVIFTVALEWWILFGNASFAELLSNSNNSLKTDLCPYRSFFMRAFVFIVSAVERSFINTRFTDNVQGEYSIYQLIIFTDRRNVTTVDGWEVFYYVISSISLKTISGQFPCKIFFIF